MYVGFQYPENMAGYSRNVNQEMARQIAEALRKRAESTEKPNETVFNAILESDLPPEEMT
jgi:hypothetical protein